MDLIKNQDVYDNFVALFTIEIDREQMTSQVVGIWKPSNSPVVLFDEVWGKDLSSRYYLVKSLTYEETRILAKKSAGKPSNISHMFAEIDEHNWEELFKSALKSIDKEYENLAPNRWYNFLNHQDC